MEGHIKLVGILHVIFGLIGVLGSLVLMVVFFFFGAGAVSFLLTQGKGGDSVAAAGVVGVITLIVVVLVAVMIVWSFLTVLVGWGVMKLKNWARIVAIILAIINIISALPSAFSVVGLIWALICSPLAIYTLWVLMSENGAKAFQRSAF
ncbi:MAG: hypothetical protein HY774_23620 [Acidobacteria bacterium]|nr:hypothetical protein [Acidobacteriota bacterium]